MDKNLENLWNSYLAQNIKFNLKNKYQKENISSERIVNEIVHLCGEKFGKEFISWLYDYILFREKIAFEVGYTVAKQISDNKS